MKYLSFIYIFSLVVSMGACSVIPPKPPEPKGRLTPINLKLHENNYVIENEKNAVIKSSSKDLKNVSR